MCEKHRGKTEGSMSKKGKQERSRSGFLYCRGSRLVDDGILVFFEGPLVCFVVTSYMEWFQMEYR